VYLERPITRHRQVTGSCHQNTRKSKFHCCEEPASYRSNDVLFGRRDHEKFNYRLVHIEYRASPIQSKQINREDVKGKKAKNDNVDKVM
jgi:hypothetical protein